MSAIDRIFRGYGDDFFGKDVMDLITWEQVEEARCFAFKVLDELTKNYGKQENGTVEGLFLNYLFEKCI